MFGTYPCWPSSEARWFARLFTVQSSGLYVLGQRWRASVQVDPDETGALSTEIAECFCIVGSLQFAVLKLARCRQAAITGEGAS